MKKIHAVSTGLWFSLLVGCTHPPYDNFKPDKTMARTATSGAAAGAVVGVITGGTLSSTLIGGAIGGGVGTVRAVYKNSKPVIVKQLKKQSIQFVEYGDTMTLIIPTDKYFMFMSPRLNELCYPGLLNVVKLLKLYPKSPIYVAGFTDNVGSSEHKKRLSQTQAETMMTYLWANGVSSVQLKAEGYGDKNPIGDNKVVHGSAYNRRIEIQWFTGLVAKADEPILSMK
jgi:outer membrane protein OmpA-like peptidoglycan-associated protein